LHKRILVRRHGLLNHLRDDKALKVQTGERDTKSGR
jgi:hypothetical protein